VLSVLLLLLRIVVSREDFLAVILRVCELIRFAEALGGNELFAIK
jgi:hypothetical protein